MSIEKVDFASEVAALKFRAGRPDVWKKTNLYQEPLFIQSILIISFYGIGNAILQLLYKTNLISLSIKDALFPVLYLSSIIGGLHIVGGFNIRRAVIAVFAIFIYSLYIYTAYKYFYSIHSYLELFQFIPGCWLTAWWIMTQPEFMGKLGLRKSNFLSDFLIASILVVFVAAYAVHFFIVIGYKLEFMPVEMSAYFSGSLITCMFLSSYCFGVWNTLKKHGANTFQGILALLALLSIIQAPGIISFILLGLVNPLMALAGFVWNAMLIVTIMHFSFTKLKNSLTATFLMATIMLLLKMAKVL